MGVDHLMGALKTLVAMICIVHHSFQMCGQNVIVCSMCFRVRQRYNLLGNKNHKSGGHGPEGRDVSCHHCFPSLLLPLLLHLFIAQAIAVDALLWLMPRQYLCS